MRHLKNILILSFVFLSYLTNAQTGVTDEKIVETKVTELYRAMVEKNQSTLENLTAETLIYGHSSGRLEDKSAYIDALMNGPFEFVTIDPADQTISISDDTAIVRHIFNAKAKNDGQGLDVHIGVLMVFQKQDGHWKLLARQAYKL
ncbi:MAG: nuclear transport factor 2 family protein [Flavobacteriaceae bacterium]